MKLPEEAVGSQRELGCAEYLWLELMAEEPDTNIWDFVPWAVQTGYLKDVWAFAHWAHNVQCLAHMPRRARRRAAVS